MNFYFFNFNYFRQFFGRQYLCDDISSFLSWSYFRWIISSNMKIERDHNDPLRINYFQKTQP